MHDNQQDGESILYYFGPLFGWMTHRQMVDWFEHQLKGYIKDNRLKYRQAQAWGTIPDDMFCHPYNGRPLIKSLKQLRKIPQA